MLEGVDRLRGLAAAEHQLRADEPVESLLQPVVRLLGHGAEQRIGELAADGGADLGDLAYRRQPVEPGHQRVVQGGRDRQRRQRAVERVTPVLLAQQAAFDNGLGQLLEEQRHAVGAGEDLLEDLGRQRLAAGRPLDQGRALAAAEAGERQCGDMRLGGPGRGELRPRGDEEQQWQR